MKLTLSLRGDIKPQIIFQAIAYQNQLSSMNIDRETRFKMLMSYAKSISNKVTVEKEANNTYIVCNL